MAIKGNCLCGATQLIATQAPDFGIRCFCRDCQHVSGGASAPQVGFATDAVTISGPLKTYTRKADSGSDLTFGFCEDCGSPITKATSKVENLVFVYAAALNDSTIIPTLKPVFVPSRAAWDKST